MKKKKKKNYNNTSYKESCIMYELQDVFSAWQMVGTFCTRKHTSDILYIIGKYTSYLPTFGTDLGDLDLFRREIDTSGGRLLYSWFSRITIWKYTCLSATNGKYNRLAT